jgi:hypothetical protein
VSRSNRHLAKGVRVAHLSCKRHTQIFWFYALSMKGRLQLLITLRTQIGSGKLSDVSLVRIFLRARSYFPRSIVTT